MAWQGMVADTRYNITAAPVLALVLVLALCPQRLQTRQPAQWQRKETAHP